MKNIYSLLLCVSLFNNMLSAQTHCIGVQYKEIFDTNKLTEIKGMLYATSTNSIYEEDLKNRKSVNAEKQSLDNEKVIIYSPLVNDNDFYITDFEKNKVEYFKYLIANSKSKVVDKFKINWQLINESKVINDIKCYKAVANFRGRMWYAWYAPSISYPFGPLKFNGLPGLIIQINDETQRYNFFVEKIEYLDVDVYLKKIEEIKSIRYNQVQTLKEFIEEREEILETAFDSANTERGTIINREKLPRSGMELIYEWEEESKKE